MWCFGNKLSNNEFQEMASKSVQLLTLMKIAILNSRVVLERKSEDEDSNLIPYGDASELGFYRFFSQCVESVLSPEMLRVHSSHYEDFVGLFLKLISSGKSFRLNLIINP